MQKIKDNYIRFALCSIFIFLGFVGMSVYPTSHSKFVDINDNALVYGTKLHKLYKGLMDLTFGDYSTYKTLLLHFDIERNNIALDNEQDLYVIEIPKSCKVVTKGLTILEGTDTTNRYQTSFSGSNNTKNIQISCNVAVDPSGVKALNIPISVYEKIEKEAQFLYKSASYSIDNYYKIRPLPEIEMSTKTFVMPKDATKKFYHFKEWIKNYMNDVYPGEETLVTTVLEYVQTVYKNDSDLLNKNLDLKGISLVYDEVSETYTYKIEDNLVGFARTYYEKNPRYMYFSSSNSTEINDAFDYYLSQNYPNLDDQKLIKDYINSFTDQGASYLVLPNSDGSYNQIKGIDYFYTENRQLVFDQSILDYAYSYTKKVIRVTYDSSNVVMLNGFGENLTVLYGDVVSESGFNAIKKTTALLKAIIRTNQSEFHEYFVVHDDELKKDLLLEVYSLAGETCNYVNLHVMDIPAGMTWTLENVNGQMKVIVNDTTVGDLNAFIAQMTPIDGVSVTGPDNLETSILVDGATAEEMLEIMKQLNLYLESLKVNSDAILKDEEESILEEAGEIEVKE